MTPRSQRTAKQPSAAERAAAEERYHIRQAWANWLAAIDREISRRPHYWLRMFGRKH